MAKRKPARKTTTRKTAPRAGKMPAEGKAAFDAVGATLADFLTEHCNLPMIVEQFEAGARAALAEARAALAEGKTRRPSGHRLRQEQRALELIVSIARMRDALATGDAMRAAYFALIVGQQGEMLNLAPWEHGVANAVKFSSRRNKFRGTDSATLDAALQMFDAEMTKRPTPKIGTAAKKACAAFGISGATLDRARRARRAR